MASLARDNPRRYDTRRRRREPAEGVASDAESGLDDPEPRHRALHHPRKIPKQQKPTHVTFNGPVTISGDIVVGHEGRRSRRREHSPPVTRGSTGRLRGAKKRPTAECDSPSESSTDSDEYLSSSSLDSVSRKGPSKRQPKSKAPTEPLQVPSSHRTKRYNPDEGYHTSATASYGAEQNIQCNKGKNKVAPSQAKGDVAAARARSRRERTLPREGDTGHSQSDLDDSVDGSDINGIAADDLVDDDGSDEEFGKLNVQVGCPDGGSTTDEEAVLDTGTKPDWVSQTFFDKLRKTAGVKSVKLIPEETRKYRDFNGKSFSPTHKVDLMIQSDEFIGMKCRILSFLIAKDATFSILIGRSTIFKLELMVRRKRETDGEGVHVGILGDVSKEEKDLIKKNKELQKKTKQERERQREAKWEEEKATKQKSRANQSSSQGAGAARLATLDPRRTRSPQRGAKGATKNSERLSDSSLEGTW
ncbi:hypothetical protein DL95DRAFT_384259 [Leptodontidium sp. 2 PMI_412]|nr:hypothetical protein DL95DRAFT_384259 [Leptodontidium sp. 2 PMI_412]